MRIISKEIDYYDALQDYQGRIWERRSGPIKTTLPNDLITFLSTLPVKVVREIGNLGYYHVTKYEPSILFFCGRAFLIWNQRSSNLRKLPARDSRDVQDAINTLERLRAPDAWFLEMGAPYFLVYRTQVEIPSPRNGLKYDWEKRWAAYLNPSLKALDFQATRDPYSAYQDIDQYLNTVLVPTEKNITTVGSDECVAQQKGFDQHSFRNVHPGGPPRKRKR